MQLAMFADPIPAVDDDLEAERRRFEKAVRAGEVIGPVHCKPDDRDLLPLGHEGNVEVFMHLTDTHDDRVYFYRPYHPAKTKRDARAFFDELATFDLGGFFATYYTELGQIAYTPTIPDDKVQEFNQVVRSFDNVLEVRLCQS